MKTTLLGGTNLWRQVAGYFDGDGAVYVALCKFVLKIRLAFYDVWKPQIETTTQFFESRGIPTRRLSVQEKGETELWNLTFSEPTVMKLVIRKLLPFSCKKRGDLLVALNYLEDRITAREAVEKLNGLVLEKRRSGYIRRFDVDLTRSVGSRPGKRPARTARDAHA